MKRLTLLQEPTLLFGHEQKMEDPRDGLTLFGPIENYKPYGIRSGIVGTEGGLKKFREYLRSIKIPVFNHNNLTRPFFPGFETVFGTKWSPEDVIPVELTEKELQETLYHGDTYHRTYDTVTLIADKISRVVKDEDVSADIWFVVLPDDVYQYCRPNAHLSKDLVVTPKTISKGAAKKILRSPFLFKEDNVEAEPYAYDADFHNQLKARLLPYLVATQIFRESTLAPYEYLDALGRPKRDFSKIMGHLAWSISTAAFYKTGGRPWKLADIRKNVCYIGLVYKLDERSGDMRNACCAAQMFLDSGDGIVFKGAVGPWYNKKRGEFHLKRQQAKELIEMAVEAYQKMEGSFPKELFIHAKTRFNDEEWRGFSDAVPSEVSLVGITIEKNVPLKLYRPDSKFPMLRGLAYIQDERSGFLWTKGFVPRLQTSLATEVPNPLFIEIDKGTAEISTVLSDILALTKLNYNACIYGDGEPVTLRFADTVGEILTAAPVEKTPPLSFKYYI